MAGDIFFGFDSSIVNGDPHNDGYVNNRTFDSFGDLLDKALSSDFPAQLEIIKEAQYLRMFQFTSLSEIDYNLVIRAMRRCVDELEKKDVPMPLKAGVWVWHEMAEPFIRKDERYDFEFHGEAKPSS